MMRRTSLKLTAAVLVVGILAVALTAVGVGAKAISHCRTDEQRVHVLFDLSTITGGPFPSDRFTVADLDQNTGRRVNLPKPNCTIRPSDCADIEVINTLDGFNLQPRISIPFDGPIDVNSVSSETVFLMRLGNTLDAQDRGGNLVGVNQIVWDPSANTLYVESDELLDQHARYAFIATNGLRDQDGKPVEASETFRQFEHDLNFGQNHDLELKAYRKSLLDALKMARASGGGEQQIVSASVFTTQSATAILEKIRRQIHEATPDAATFGLGPAGERTVFPLNELTGIALRQQTRVTGPLSGPVNVNLPLLRIIPGAVGQIAFGKYLSPDYEIHPGEFIPPVGTRTGTPLVRGVNEIYFTLTLPSGAKPEGGWPIAIHGHGGGLSKDVGGGLPNIAAAMAEQGVATIAINVVGHGFGPLSTLTVSKTSGVPVTFPAGGRGSDLNGDGVIDAREGIRAAAPQTIIDDSDGFRQTVVDLMQLVRVIEIGMDVDGDTLPDLNPSRIYYVGQSLGGMYGTDFLAVEPDVHAGVINVAGGSRTSRVLNNFGDRPLYGSYLADRTPSLINAPGVTRLDGAFIAGLPLFDENMPLRDGVTLSVGLSDGTTRAIQSPVVNIVPGAIEIQQFLENTEWVMQSANPVAYAPHLRKVPLDQVPPKSVIVQFAKGDQTVPNPATTALVRAGDLADRTMYYRHDLAYAERPTLPKNPHGFMIAIGAAGGFLEIGLPVQRQIASFFASDGNIVIQPEPARYFEMPIMSPLPESLNYIP